MRTLRNPLLLALCLVLLANLLFNRPDRPGMPHGRRRDKFPSGANGTAPAALAGEGRREGDAAFGQMLFASNCTACHGPRGHGMPRQGANLRESKFIAERSDSQLIAFLRQGRTPADPTSVMGMLMPPRGGNRALDDAALADLVAFIRELQEDARLEAAASASGNGSNTH
jgi:mono/diheme cytochrome c family protein